MEFTSVVGSQHILEPIGYNIVRKRKRRDVCWVVRSIQEQYMIHSLAADFSSQTLYIPKPILIESSNSYTMEFLYLCKRMDPSQFSSDPTLFDELIRFKNYMYVRGYFAAGFSILKHPERPVYILVDFSQFGSIDQFFVMFPKIPKKYTILEAEHQFGLVGRDIVTESFKKKHVLATSSPLVVPLSECAREESSQNAIILDDETLDWNKIETVYLDAE